jgi:hypothetical protein
MKEPRDVATSLLRKKAADALRRARKLPVGHARNDLRQLAMGLLWLNRKGMQAKVQDRQNAIGVIERLRCLGAPRSSR